MQWSRSWGCRVTLVGTIVLVCALLAGDGRHAAPSAAASSVAPATEAPLQEWRGDCDPDFDEATQQVLNAVRLVYPVVDYYPVLDRFWSGRPLAMAFHIGNDEWVTTAWEDFSSPIALYQHDPTAWNWLPDVGSRRDATLVGRDAFTGVALLQADGTGVPALRLGAAAPQVGDRLRRVSYGYWLDSRPRGHVSWPARCAAVSDGPTGHGGATPPSGLVVAETPRQAEHISLRVLEGTVQELLTVDGRHYLHHDMFGRTRARDCCPGFNVDPPTGAPLFTPDGAVVGMDGHGIWRAEPVGRDRADVIAYDIAGPTLPALVARIRANAGTVGDAGGGRTTLEAFCPRERWDAAREAWQFNRHPDLCGAHAQAGIRALETERRWSFWFSGPGRRDLVLYRLTDSAGRDTKPRAIDHYSVAEDPQRHLQRLPPGTYGMQVLAGFQDEDPIWSNRVPFRLLPAAGGAPGESLDDVLTGWPLAATEGEPASPQAWREAADRASLATFRVWVDPEHTDWYEPTPFMAVHLGNDEWIAAGRAPPGVPLALAPRHVSTSQKFTLGFPDMGFRSATVIGYDEPTGLSLLRATGEDVPSLALAASRPALCAPLLLAGYWESGRDDFYWEVEPSPGPHFAEDCTPAVVPGIYWPATDDDVRETIRSLFSRGGVDLIPGQPETALAGIFAHAGLPYLLLHPPDPEHPWWGDIRVQGGPVIAATGEVAGIHTQVQLPAALVIEEDVTFYSRDVEEWVIDDGQQWALAAPAVGEALARIRAAAIHTLAGVGVAPLQVAVGETVRLDVQARDRSGRVIDVWPAAVRIDWYVDPPTPLPSVATALPRALRPLELAPVPGVPTAVHYTPVTAGPVTVRGVTGACTVLTREEMGEQTRVSTAWDGPCAVAFPITVIAPLPYDRLDIAGRARAAGSYAFLEIPGDRTSAMQNVGNGPEFAELRIHPTDADGADLSAFYAGIRVGDRFDYRPGGIRGQRPCGFRYAVTRVTPGTPWVFRLAAVARYGGGCPDPPADPGGPFPSAFRWHVQPGYLGADGVRVLLEDEPAGHGTYRLLDSSMTDFVIDVPQGMEVIRRGGAQRDRPEDAGVPIVLEDAASGSILRLDADTGEERGRRVLPRATSPGASGTALPAVGALFDQIVESARRVEPGPVGLAALEEIQEGCSAPHADYVWSLIDHLLRFHQELVVLLALQEELVLDIAAIRAQIVRVAERTDVVFRQLPPTPDLDGVWDATYRALAWGNDANSYFLKVLERDPRELERDALPARADTVYFDGHRYVDRLQRFQAQFARAGQLLGDYCAVPDEPAASLTLQLRAGGDLAAVPAGAATTAADLFGGTDVTIVWQYNRATRAWDRSYLPATGRGGFAIMGGDVLWVVAPAAQTLPVAGMRPPDAPAAADPITLTLRQGGDLVVVPAGAATTAAELFGGTDVASVWQYNRATRAWDRSYLPARNRGGFPIAPGDVLWVVASVAETVGD